MIINAIINLKQYVVTLSCVLVMVLLHKVFVFTDLAYFADATFTGYRLLTSHLVHSDAQHLLLNMLGIALLGSQLEKHGRGYLMLAIGCAVMAISGYVLFADIQRYCGFSGVLNGLFVCFLYQRFRTGQQRVLLTLLSLGYVAKLITESLTHEAIFSATQWPSFTPAHWLGAAAGLLVCGLHYLCIRSGSKQVALVKSDAPVLNIQAVKNSSC